MPKNLDFTHPLDREALLQLESLPVFASAVKTFLKFGPERVFHGLNMAQKVRLGPEQLPDLYELLPPVCDFLGIDVPEFYLELNPTPNAYTSGDTRVYVTVTSGLVESMQKEEIRAVLAHECGHIACRHVLYHTVAQLVTDVGGALLGPLSSLSLPVRAALAYWSRRSELSADRAAALVLGSPDPVVATMVRLAGVPRSIAERIDLKRYMQQADAYDEMLRESRWDKLLHTMAGTGHSHPLLAVRAREVMNWGRSEEFQRLLCAAASNVTRPCHSCGRPVRGGWKYCGHCGQASP